MNKVVGGIVGIVVLVVGVFFAGGLGFGIGDSDGDSIRVASFNGEIFGDAKLENVGVDYYVDLIGDYDLFFLLEIRDADNSSFEELCGALVGYECYLSARSGRSISKEAVGVFVKSGNEVFGFGEYEDSAFERGPVWIDVLDTKYWAVHLNPDDVYREMEALEVLVGIFELGVGSKTVVLGDMNADCDYYSSGVDFDGWEWVIGDDEDTATGFKDCAYDRIIVSSEVSVLESGVVEIEPLISDHNLVFVEIGN